MSPEHIFTHSARVTTETPEELMFDPKMPIYKVLDEALARRGLVYSYNSRLATVELVFGIDGDTTEEAEANTRQLIDETWTTLSLGILRVVSIEVKSQNSGDMSDERIREILANSPPDPQIAAWMAAAHRAVEEEQRRRTVIGPDATILNFRRADPQSDQQT